MNALQPKMLILAETEFWPNLLAACYRRNIPVVVVNARISDRSWPRYRGLRRLWKPFLSRLSAVLAQSTLDAERLHAIGCSNVSIAGNLKFDVRAPQESDATRLLKALAPRPRFLVAGSTLEGEEAAFLSSNLRLSLAGMNPLLITVLAPRHPDRFNEVARLLEQSGVRWVRRSAWQGKTLEDIEPLHGGEVVLLDTIGELASVYSLATVAFVGGSLVAAGGHNPLEPAQFAVPIVMGPHYANFRAITDDLIAHNAIRIAAPEQLATVLVDLLNDRQSAQALGARARHVFEQQSGATARCVASIRALLPNHAQASAPQPVAAERNV
jgi:3-deoxy-D-manno-octulosonic-acid transferase